MKPPDAGKKIYELETHKKSLLASPDILGTDAQIPVIDLAYELVLPEEFIGECVSTAMDIGFLTAPKRGTFGGKITPKALRKLKQVGKHRT